MPNLAELLQTLEDAASHRDFHKALFFKPYPKQKLFFDLGRTKRERLFMAANQVGKSEGGAFEAACHATGIYPPDWQGKVFTEPTRGWVAGVTSLDVRNIQQKKLFGDPGVTSMQGTGMVPKDRIIDISLARGVTDAFDTVQVKHTTNGVEDGTSTVHFKSYEQGRAKFQGDTIHWGWGDEEPEKMEVYSEFLARLRGDGILFTTFTPLFGLTELVTRFTQEEHADRGYVSMTLNEAMHFTAEEKRKRLEGYQRHERDARAKGVPLLGSGRVFIVPEEEISEPAIEHVPEYWRKLWGIDFGIGHPFAAVLILYDADNDVIHVHYTVRMVDDQAKALPMHHAAAMKPMGADVPVAWPHDGAKRESGSGEALALLYKAQGLRMHETHSTWPDGGYSTEAGIKEMEDRMMTGRFKVASQLSQWFEEYRTYHRKEGQIVKVRDDLMSATRIAVMMKRIAKPVMLGGLRTRRRTGQIAEGVDFDVFDVA